jgi:hypothetical protein
MAIDRSRLESWFAKARDTRARLGERAGELRSRAANAEVPLPAAPPWLTDARLALARHVEAAGCRCRLWWLARTAPLAAWIAEASRHAADRVEEARDRLSGRLRPILRRMAERWKERVHRAIERREALAVRLADLRERHLDPVVAPLVHAVERHVPDAARGLRESARGAGLSGMRLAAAAVAAVSVAWLWWRIQPAHAPTATDDEIQLTASFVTQSGPDPTAWLRAVGMPGPPQR